MAPSISPVDSQLEVEETHSAPPPSLHFAEVWMVDVKKVHNLHKQKLFKTKNSSPPTLLKG